MFIRFSKVFFSIIVACATVSNLEAAYTLKNNRLVKAEECATRPAEEHFQWGLEALQNCNWKEACIQFRIITTSFPSTPYSQEGYFYLGVCWFNLEEFDFANDAFSLYLNSKSNPRFFQETIEYKFLIAEKLGNGARRRILSTKQLPKWASGRDLALKVYDEVIAAMPSNEMAAQALYSKGCLLWKMRLFRESIDSFQMVIRRFPRHELAPECYLTINRVYLEQSQLEFQNPDILAFAQINLRKFKNDFPREERICEAEEDVMQIKEIYARGLYDTALFYERTHKLSASVLYYKNTIKQFPDTCVAEWCRLRLAEIFPGQYIEGCSTGDFNVSGPSKEENSLIQNS
jgi:outer membrane protein assembly factor BamD (BamD/ComL family)